MSVPKALGITFDPNLDKKIKKETLEETTNKEIDIEYIKGKSPGHLGDKIVKCNSKVKGVNRVRFR